MMRKVFLVFLPLLLFVSISIGSNAQVYDTLSIYFKVDSDLPIVNRSSEYANYKQKVLGTPKVIQLEAHCDTTGSMEHNDDLAQRRLDAVRKQLAKDGWKIEARFKVSSERVAGSASNYSHNLYRRVDVIFRIDPLSNAELLTIQLNNFLKDTVKEKSIDLQIVFYAATTNLMTEAIPETKALKDFMVANPTIHIDIHGHVCCGPNHELSLNRAKMIAELLMSHGVDSKRMTYQGHSNMQPKISPELTPNDEKQNRRVAIVLKKSVS